jgi:hypothetical protein
MAALGHCRLESTETSVEPSHTVEELAAFASATLIFAVRGVEGPH